MKRWRIVLLELALFTAYASARAAAQARPTVPPSERVYRDIDRLAAAGLIDTLLVGVRPFSEREVMRLLGEARRNLPRNPSARAWAERIIDADVHRFERSGHPRAIDAMRLEGTRLSSPYRDVPNEPAGNSDAVINPLAANRQGRALANGGTAAIETDNSVILGSHVALSLTPRLTMTDGSTADAGRDHLSLQRGSVAALWRNVRVDAGRDDALFGTAPTGGMLLSATAPTVDMVRLSNDAPFVLPWLFHFAGPWRGALLIADLGADHVPHPHERLIAYHLAALPHPRLEVGLGLIDVMGGRGGLHASFGNRILDAIPVSNVIRNFDFSNKMLSADFRWRVPSPLGLELYGETALDDFDATRIASSFDNDGAYLAGVSASCLLQCGTLGVRAEYHKTGVRYDVHTDYPFDVDRIGLGDPLGPRGDGAYVTIDGEPSPLGYLALDGALEWRSGNTYDAVPASATRGFHFEQVGRRPGEKRARAVLSWAPVYGDARTQLTLRSGVEHVTNYQFAAGAHRINWLGQIELSVRP